MHSATMQLLVSLSFYNVGYFAQISFMAASTRTGLRGRLDLMDENDPSLGRFHSWSLLSARLSRATRQQESNRQLRRSASAPRDRRARSRQETIVRWRVPIRSFACADRRPASVR